MSWHMRHPEAIAAELHPDLVRGLTEQDAQARLSSEGANELPDPPAPSPLYLLLHQFTSVIIWVLMGAAVMSGLLQEWIDAGAILAIVLLNALLGFIQEFKAERSLAALRKLSVATARVVREGVVRAVPARELVRGDLIQVEAGDHVPADARLIYATNLFAQEAALTGESAVVEKSSALLSAETIPLSDQSNLLFLGTVVTAGKGRAIIVSTGSRTELGRIASLMQQRPSEVTPLERRLRQLGNVLLFLSLAIVAVVFVLGLLRDEPLAGMFLTAVSLAVAAIPEGLPAVVTIALALGVMRMVKRHVLVRRIHAVETLGATTVICTDKTGTLTKNEMTVTSLVVGGHIVEVTGEGYAPVGEFLEAGSKLSIPQPALLELLLASVLCNDAALKRQGDVWQILGDPSEGALLVAAAKFGLLKDQLEKDYPFLGEAPFDQERKRMTVVRELKTGAVAFVKGAPDILLQCCTHRLTSEGLHEPLDDLLRQRILAANDSLAAQALRVMGVARRSLPNNPLCYDADDLERDLVFLGLVAMRDPLRPEVKAAMQTCREAGIRIVMITGDHKQTAVAVAGELGLIDDRGGAISGSELDQWSDERLREGVDRLSVYARVTAEHKLRIVRAWKARGAVVAMTGDGINDAPAIKEADIGIAMGLTGTDVAREASDIVVTDDNFASIASAVEAGRVIYDNIVKAVQYLLSGNIGEILVMLCATAFGLPLPLLPVHILWVNLVTDSLPALALVVEPAAVSIMRRAPRHPNAAILDRSRLVLICAQGCVIAAITIGAFVYLLFGLNSGLDQARTAALTVLVAAHLVNAFNCRSNEESVFLLGLLTNKALLLAVCGSILLQIVILSNTHTREIFRAVALTPALWMLVLGLGFLPLAVMEAWKLARRLH